MAEDLFDKLPHTGITVHLLMDLQQRYPDLQPQELEAYQNRTQLRVRLLVDFAAAKGLPVRIQAIKEALQGVEASFLDSVIYDMQIEEAGEALPSQKGCVYLFNGGPATGKSTFIQRMTLPENTIALDRDSYFAKLSPYSRLAQTHPDHATHAVVCEAILYNERDAYRYALLSGAENIVVDGTMSYRDLGLEMIQNAQANGYRVKVINIDCDLDLAIARATKRAALTGKTINTKLLYESHVRCAKNFFDYQSLADVTENWLSLPSGECVLTAHSHEILQPEAMEALRVKAQLPLDNPSWPPDFDSFLHGSTHI